jgi:hypothetical protein
MAVGFVSCASTVAVPPPAFGAFMMVPTFVEGDGGLICSWIGQGQCGVARYSLTCTSKNGGGAICISDDLAQCPGGANTAVVDVTYVCENQCRADEYGAVCVGEAQQEQALGCRSLGVTPAATAYYCCPCAT